ncbi:MAG TPA: diaminopimelate decarboxylase [Candidatus Binatia bacterium]
MTQEARTLVDKYFGNADGQLSIGGIPISRIVEEFGTPLFVYDAEILRKKWRALRETFPGTFAISYSVKANPNPFLLKWFLDRGCGLEIASGGEFHLALTAGCAPAQLIFAGPGKSQSELETVLSRGIGEIHIESALEATRVNAISRRLGIKARVALRVNPDASAQGGAMQMGGKPAPFGVDEEQLDEMIDRLMKLEFLEFRGLHFYLGTQILDHATLGRQYRHGVQIAKRVVEKIGRALATIDFGGGLGIPYFAGEEELETDKLRNELCESMHEIANEPAFLGTQFIIEPGRYLVGEAGIYVTQVSDIKVSRERKYVIVDGGMNHHLAASGNLGQVIKRNFPVAVLNKLNEARLERMEIVGPLCTPLDALARDVELPEVQVGDWIGIFQSGAYARAASPLGFLSYPSPAEVLVEEGRPLLIRRRGTVEDLLSDIPVAS